ncbi:hypothetical protein [Microvirga terricola]|uniref:Uncharacterized protein n=1 Tax=Microvirga terricola TaxID=2719797 RepID=A0ABX0V795_9HYPH|nr:hypothetical protein [Microvirga terricola]NIX75453.1 hypothetical protein [Microvirga terricola]
MDIDRHRPASIMLRSSVQIAALLIWGALPFLPMLIGLHWPTLTFVLLGGFLVLVLALPVLGGPVAFSAESPSILQKYLKRRAFLISFLLLSGTVLVCTELVLVARAMAERSHTSWLLAIASFQDAVVNLLSPYIPALERLPADLKHAGFEARISVVTGAFGIAYLASVILLAFTIPATVLSIVVLWRDPGPGWDLKERLNTSSQWFASLFGPSFFAPFAIYMVYIATGVQELPGRKEIFANFETYDLDLIYRATLAAGMGGLALPLMFVPCAMAWRVRMKQCEGRTA